MMGFGPSSSSTSSAFSNLSALAPPFSIDRPNPNKQLTSNSNPILLYSDFTSMDRSNPNPDPIPRYSELTCDMEPFSQTWQYAQPSAPRSELIVDPVASVGMPSVPPAPADIYQFPASAVTSPSNGYWSEPFYSPYVPPMAGGESPLHGDSGPRYDEVVPPVNYMHGLYDLEYGPRWMGGNTGSNYGKQHTEESIPPDGSLLSAKANFAVSHGYNNQLNQGHGTEYGSNYKEGTGVSCERFGLVSDSDLHTAFSGTRHLEDKPCLEQNLNFLSPDYSNKPISVPASSSFLAARPLGLSSEMHTNFSDYHHNSCSENKGSLWPVGSPLTRLVSTVRSSPAVVIRPPSMVSGVLGQNGDPHSTASNDNIGCAVFRDFDLTSSSNIKDLGEKLNADVKEDSFETDLLNLSNRVNYQIFGSPSVKELSAPLHTKNTYDQYTEARFVSQPPNVNVLDGFGEVQAVASAELSSDSVDRHSLGVDSPCWRGAHTSQFSWLDEDDRFNHSKKNEMYCSEHEKHENILSAEDSTRNPASDCEGNQNQRSACSHDGEGSASVNGAKPEVRVSAVTRSIGVKINKDLDIPRKDSGISNNVKSGFDMKISKPSDSKQLNGEMDTGLALNYVLDGNIAVHAAEKVLASPCSQDDTAEETKLQQSDPRMDVPMVINAMHNLSALLLSHQSNDAFILEEKDNETLKHIISNLDTCMSKKIIQPISGTKLDYPIGDTSILGDSCMACPNMSTTSEAPQKTSELKDSHTQRDYWSMYEEVYDNSGNKDEKSPVFSPLRDDLEAKDDLVTKAIKKVLDENFNFNEEMHSQALMFKNLWLEAEAKLCTISYRARFDRMKVEMDKLKPKAPTGNIKAVEMLLKVDTSPIINTDAEFIREEYDGVTSKPVIEDSSLPSITMHADETETSVMTRFSILKSREENMNETETSLMTRFSILKSLEDNMKPINEEEEKHPEIADGDSAGSVMDRLNILKSRVENSESFSLEEEKTPEVSSAGFSDQNHLGTSIKDNYGSQEMLNSSVANVPIIHSFYDSSRMMNQQYSLWRGSSSSSDWEHVLKDDFAWKNS